MWREFISLFCDHKEIRNSLIGVGVKCFVLSQAGGGAGLGCQRLINDTRWLVTIQDKASLSRYSNAACPAWTCDLFSIYFNQFKISEKKKFYPAYYVCQIFTIAMFVKTQLNTPRKSRGNQKSRFLKSKSELARPIDLYFFTIFWPG